MCMEKCIDTHNTSFCNPYIAIIINPIIHPRGTKEPLASEVGVTVGSEALTHAPEYLKCTISFRRKHFLHLLYNIPHSHLKLAQQL